MTEELRVQHEAMKFSRSKDERMIDIFELINSAPPANNTEEAFKLIHDSFSHVEENATDPMNVGDFHKMLEMKIEGKNIHYCWYIGHVLLIGENGSIEIREKPTGGFDGEAFTHDQAYVRVFFNLILSKTGADNQGIW